jgi:hypothetical protein
VACPAHRVPADLCAQFLDNALFLAPIIGPELFRTKLSKNA